MSNWNWKVVRQFLKRSFDLGLSRSSCLNYLHRLGFVLKRPKKRLLKAKDEERKAFVLQYRQIREEAQESGAKIFFVDEAHFRADADLGCRMGGKWVLRGQPALVAWPGAGSSRLTIRVSLRVSELSWFLMIVMLMLASVSPDGMVTWPFPGSV